MYSEPDDTPLKDYVYFVARGIGGFGGGDRAAVDVLRAILAAGENVVVVSEMSPLRDELFGESGSPPVWSLAPRPLTRVHLTGTTTRQILSDIRSALIDAQDHVPRARGLRRTTRAYPPAAIIHNGFPNPRATYLATLNRTAAAPRVMIVHSSAEAVPSFAVNTPGLSVQVLARQMSECDGLIFVSSQIRDEWFGVMDSVPPLVRTIPVCVRDESVDALRAQPRADVRKQVGYGDDEFVIVTVGKVHPMKGQQMIVSAMPEVLQHVPNARLSIVGQRTKQSDRLEDEMAGLGVSAKVTFQGATEQALEHIYAADLLVHASMAEGFGLVIAEAMALGTPVVASDAGGARSLVLDRKTGLRFSVGDQVTMVNRILEVAAHPEEARARAALAETHYRTHFSRPVMTAAYAEFLKVLLTSDRAGRRGTDLIEAPK